MGVNLYLCISVLIYFPVYRTYVLTPRISQSDRKTIQTAIKTAKKTSRLNDAIFRDLKCLLLHKSDFTLKFQQLTPSIMAKGLEDSTFYIYNRLISLNEVGGYPEHVGKKPEDFHRFNKEKLSKHPFGLRLAAW